MDAIFKVPFYAKAALIFISLFAFVFVMHIGREIIVPIVYATIISILLNPFVNFLVKKKINRVVSIFVAVALACIIAVGSVYMISSHVADFSDSYPQLKQKFNTTSSELIRWGSKTFNIRQSKIKLWVNDSQSEAIDDFAIAESLSQIGSMVITVVLLPVYLFMMLFYKPLLLEFIHRLFKTEHHTAVVQVLSNTKQIVQTYLVGLFFEMIIMAILNSVGLLLLGIQYALILGILGAILNIIPYIGGIVATALAMIIAFVTKDSLTYPILVLLLYVIIQLIDNNFIVPIVVASRVKINALISVIAVVIGGALWGISGMFLSIPLIAILKVVFDHIDPLKPWGFLLGNIVPTVSRFSFARPKRGHLTVTGTNLVTGLDEQLKT
jgi:predicted PurR-regulated permease PerM